MDPERVTYFGETDSRSKRVKFGIKSKDRTRHVYIIGKTGMGKSTLLENMAIQDLANGEGMAFIDPHGKTAELLLDYIPPERIKDIIYFAPFDTEHPISFNVLEDVGFEKRHLVVAGLMSTFKKIWLDAWSARMEYILTNTLLALIEYPGATLLGVNRMLADKEYRKRVVDNVKDASVKSFWVDEFAKYTEKFAAEATPAIQNKIGQFTSNPLIRDIVGQPKSSIDIRKIMDEKKILIINLSKGRVGEANANLLGSMLITKIYLAAMSRADIHEKELKKLPNFYLYVDEFQSFANESFADILSEARKYKLNLTIAHQYIEQMSEEVRAAVFGNVGTFITFRVGAIDAEVLEKEFAPQFTAEDLVNLGMFQMYLKLMIDGVSSTAFSASSLPPFPEQVISYRSEIIANSRAQFAQPRLAVEEAIHKWYEEGKVVASPKKDDKAVSKTQTTQTTQVVQTTKTNQITQTIQTKPSSGEVKKENKSSDYKEQSSKIVSDISKPKIEYKPAQVLNSEKPISTSSVGAQTESSVVKRVGVENKKVADLPPLESDTRDDFLPIGELAKKVIIDEKQNRPQEKKKTDGKVMSKGNMSDLKSALENVLKNNNHKVEDKPIKKQEEVKTEVRKEEKTKIEHHSDNHNSGPKEIPEGELKKILGIE